MFVNHYHMFYPLVSIIVPVYKVESYLQRCLDSIVNQTYTNLEIILIDDGSPDNCPQICDEYAAKDKRIVVIHKENGGLSDARNAGLDICQGEYITFIDSDDWVADEYVATMINLALENNAEIVVGGVVQTQNTFNLKLSNIGSTHFEILTPLESVKKLWSIDVTAFTTVWGILYKKTLWTNLKFPKGLIHEDLYVSYKPLYTSSKTIYIDIPVYYYYQRESSITKDNPDSLVRKLRPRYERYLFFKERRENEITALCLKTLCWEFINAFADAYTKNILPIGFSSKKEMQHVLKQIIADSRKMLDLSVSQSFFLTIVCYAPFLFLWYRKHFPVNKKQHKAT